MTVVTGEGSAHQQSIPQDSLIPASAGLRSLLSDFLQRIERFPPLPERAEGLRHTSPKRTLFTCGKVGLPASLSFEIRPGS